MPGGAGVAQANIPQQLFDSSKACHGLLKAEGKKKLGVTLRPTTTAGCRRGI